jgi:transcriptional regulator with XRE-family HTH domain
MSDKVRSCERVVDYLAGNGGQSRRMLSSLPMGPKQPQVGSLLRQWRQRRRVSQLALACEAEISARHLSFLETGRSSPSREMILHLSEQLGVPLRERNVLLVASGYAPVFPETSLDAPALGPARKAVDLILTGHEPYPALAIDRHWNLIASNRMVPLLLAGADGTLLRPPINVLRLTLHPSGLATRIANLTEWRAHLLERLARQIELTADSVLLDLMKELKSYPEASKSQTTRNKRKEDRDYAGVIVPLELVVDDHVLAFFSTTTVFGTPVDITLSELALEAFFPADAATAETLHQLSPR